MSAMRIIDNVHKNGGKIEELFPLREALPAPEAINNPMGIQISAVVPKGVVLASRNAPLT